MLYSAHMRAFVQEVVTSRIPAVCSITTISCSLWAPEYQTRHAAWSVEHVLAWRDPGVMHKRFSGTRKVLRQCTILTLYALPVTQRHLVAAMVLSP